MPRIVSDHLAVALNADISADERWHLVNELAERNQAEARSIMGIKPVVEGPVNYEVQAKAAAERLRLFYRGAAKLSKVSGYNGLSYPF
jgi:hypothetical protein